MADFVTFPMPLEPDIEIVRRMGNFTYQNPRNCSGPCGNGSETAAGAEEQVAWMGASEDVLYYAFPAVIGWGVLTGLLSVIVMARQVRASYDSYLLGFLISSILLLSCGGLLKVDEYISHSNTYQYAYVYVKSFNDWLWYASLWILVVMSLERGMTVAQQRSKNMCTPVQGCIVTVMVFAVCLVSALPQFWEYEVTETFDYGANQTLAMSQLSEAASTPEYRIMYFWYTVSITVFLPYPILIVMLAMLSQGLRHSRASRRRHSTKHGTGSILNRKVAEEMHVTRLFIVMILLYFLLTGPLTFLQVINGITPSWMWPQDSIYTGLYSIFEFAFYFYFATTFLLLCSYYDKFRYTLARTCCCRCVTAREKRDKRNVKQKRRSDRIDHEIIIPVSTL